MGWDSESEHSSDDEEHNTLTTYILVTIDCDELMFEKDENNDESTFKTVLKACYEVMDKQLMKGGKRAITPFAIAVVSDDIDKMSICNFKDHLPTTLKTFRELCEMSDQELEAKYKRKTTLQMSNFLLHCKKLLSACGQENPKYITYITKDANPVGDDENDRRLCVNQAKTFKDFNLYLELLTFNESFDYDIFFKEILEAANCKFSYEYFTDMIGLKEKLLSLVIYRGSRVLFFPFNNRHNFFQVIEKRFVKPLKILNNVAVTKDTNTELREVKRGGDPKDTFSLWYSPQDGPMSLTLEERNALVYDDIPVGFSLLGTYKGDMIDVGKHSIDPKIIQRNKSKNCPHFDIFWQYCVDNDSKLICTRKYRKDAATKLVQLTAKLVNGIRSFLVLGIPNFEDIHYQDIHNPLYQPKSTGDKDIMKAAEDLVEALDFHYDPLKIHDTVNCRKWEYIRSELLEEKPREVVDVLDLEVVENDVTDVIKAFKKLTPVTGIKRKADYKNKPRKK